MIYGYARVSTTGQAQHGTSLDEQGRVLREHGAEEVFSDSFTGTRQDRPALTELLDVIEAGDTLIVTKLDRVARSLSQGVELINGLIDRGVRVHILNLGLMDNTPSSKMIRGIFFAFAEFERDMIVERTQEGREIARQRKDYRDGAPRQDLPGYERLKRLVDAKEVTVMAACRELDISRTAWYSRRRTDRVIAERRRSGE